MDITIFLEPIAIQTGIALMNQCLNMYFAPYKIDVAR